MTRPTEEGAPVTDIYRVIGDQQLERMSDLREDPLRSADFSYAVCTDLDERGPPPDSCETSEERRVPRPQEL